MNFAEELKSERQRLGLTQAEAAAALEVNPRTIWKWENDEPPLHLTQEGALARLRRTRPKIVRASSPALSKETPSAPRRA